MTNKYSEKLDNRLRNFPKHRKKISYNNFRTVHSPPKFMVWMENARHNLFQSDTKYNIW